MIMNEAMSQLVLLRQPNIQTQYREINNTHFPPNRRKFSSRLTWLIRVHFVVLALVGQDSPTSGS